MKHSLYMYINLHLLKPTCLIGSMGCFSVLGSILILPVLILRFSACGFIRNLESGLFEVTRGGLRGRENTSWSKECLKSIELMFMNYRSNVSHTFRTGENHSNSGYNFYTLDYVEIILVGD